MAMVGLSVHIAGASDGSPLAVDSTVPPDRDVRLARLTNAQPAKVGILTYYPNKGGGYTFMDGKRIDFYSLPYLPTTYKLDYLTLSLETGNGQEIRRQIAQQIKIQVIGSSHLPFGGQTLFRSAMKDTPLGFSCRVDTPIAKWSRDTSDANFQLLILSGEYQTRLKLKSIVPVLEEGFKRQSSKL